MNFEIEGSYHATPVRYSGVSFIQINHFSVIRESRKSQRSCGRMQLIPITIHG